MLHGRILIRVELLFHVVRAVTVAAVNLSAAGKVDLHGRREANKRVLARDKERHDGHLSGSVRLRIARGPGGRRPKPFRRKRDG